jgi:hypothetical protein
MNGDDVVREHRRLTILRLLHSDPQYTLNESILHDLLLQWHFSAARDVLRGDLAWLASQGLLRSQDIGNLMLATLTTLGIDVAAGRHTVPGIKRPSPK